MSSRIVRAGDSGDSPPGCRVEEGSREAMLGAGAAVSRANEPHAPAPRTDTLTRGDEFAMSLVPIRNVS